MAALLAVTLSCAASSTAAYAAPALTFTGFSAGSFNADGSPSTQAGAHPWELRTYFEFGTVLDPRVGIQVPDAAAKDTAVAYFPGLMGNPRAIPQCSQEGLDTLTVGCPGDTQIGYADVEVAFTWGRSTVRSPVYNMVPPPGEPAQFGFLIIASITHINLSIRSDGDYGATATVHNVNGAAPLYGATIHLWGVPSDPAHGGPSGQRRPPLLRNPTSCTGPLTATIAAVSWGEPDQLVTTTSQAPATTGCASLPFAPSLSLTPDTKRAGSPAGFGVDLDLPQNEAPDALATADLKRAVVTLPSGVAINPSAGDGLDGCSDAQFALHSTAQDNCPDASVIGTLKVTSPALPNPLEGSVYVADPLEQGTAAAAAGQMFRAFLEAHGSGVRVKLTGSVVPDPTTGQLTVTLDNSPQLPFTNAHMQFNGGPRAPLSLPKACGTYTTHAQFTSWASETPVSSDNSFTLDQNCDQAARFEPSLSAGLTSLAAGASAPFTMTLSRPDGQQDFSGLELSLPPGLSGYVGSVPLCPDAQAAAGTCSSASQIGHVAAAAGAGTAPVWIPQQGKTPTAIFLAGPYKGAPFSLSVVVPAQAGPFDLGNVVIRVALFVDKHDGHVSVKTDAIPTILDGVPLNVQTVNATVDRPGFMVAPTNCKAMQITGTASSSAGATAGLASRFQVGSCAALKFTPKFSASLTGVAARKGRAPASIFASKANGVSLHVKLAYPAGSAGKQANVGKVKVELPKQLPSRLATLQKACTSAQFAANPAGCPAASIVGSAKVNTPLLPVPLTGPAYFVSHGGEAFPSLTIVLQGYGVTIELVGATFIDKAGVTSTTFNSAPDVPFSSFELTLPQGKFSAITGNGDLCKPRLVMPTDYVAQNGIRLHQSNRIAVTGCKKAKARRAGKSVRRH